MALKDDQSAQVHEPSPPVRQSKEGDERVSIGRWSYDEASKQYAITVRGQTTNYSLLSHDGIETCMLVKGCLKLLTFVKAGTHPAHKTTLLRMTTGKPIAERATFFAKAIKHRPRIILTIRQRTRVLDQYPRTEK
jgi:hypothetical protein